MLHQPRRSEPVMKGSYQMKLKELPLPHHLIMPLQPQQRMCTVAVQRGHQMPPCLILCLLLLLLPLLLLLLPPWLFLLPLLLR
jgi:hypothetical protein